MLKVEHYESDVVVVGSGGAGCTAAIEARRQGVRTLMMSKGPMGRSGATLLAGADLMVDGRSMLEMGYAGDPTDSPEKWAKEILIEGFYLGDQKLVEAFVREAPGRAKDIIGWGMKVHYLADPRSFMTTGPEMCNALRKGLSLSDLKILEPVMAIELLISEGRVRGILGMDLKTGSGVLIKTKAVILATGGIHQMFPFNSGSDELSGDAQGLAYRAGAELINMEFITFCPLVILNPQKYRGSIFTYIYMHTAGMDLTNRKGQPFLFKYDPEVIEMALNSEWDKLILSQAIAREIQIGRGTKNGGVWFSVNSIPRNVRANIIKRLKGTHWQGNDFGPLLKWLDEGYAIEVAPAAHYFEGGIHIQPNCETNIPGLFAAGECAAGVFGANRVAAATTEMIIEGHLAGASAAQFAKKNELGKDPLRLGDLIFEKVTTPLNRSKGLRPTELKNHVQLLASNNLWVIRDEKGMNRLLAEIQSLKEGLKDLSIPGKNHLPFNKEWITALELQNLIPMLEVTAHAALKRTESRGVHYRTDYPQTDFDHWNCNLVARNLNGIPALTRKDLNITAVNIPKGKVDYLESIKMAIQALETC